MNTYTKRGEGGPLRLTALSAPGDALEGRLVVACCTVAEGRLVLLRLLLLRPGGRDAGHAGVGDELAHVLVGMNDDAEIHAVDGGVAISLASAGILGPVTLSR